MVTYQLFAENIKCIGCVNKIKENLQKMEGIMGVDVTVGDGKVCVSAIAVGREKIARKLAELGYPEKGHNSLLSKARSFVTCTIEKLAEH